jgi:hypothetical protein
MKRSLLLLPALLIGCGTPQEQCIAAGTRDLRTVEALISQTEGNLQRGYALEDRVVEEEVFGFCQPPAAPPPEGELPPPPPPPEPCWKTEVTTETTAVAIDLDAEARKLKQLKQKRADLQRQADKLAADCRLRYPE